MLRSSVADGGGLGVWTQRTTQHKSWRIRHCALWYQKAVVSPEGVGGMTRRIPGQNRAYSSQPCGVKLATQEKKDGSLVDAAGMLDVSGRDFVRNRSTGLTFSSLILQTASTVETNTPGSPNTPGLGTECRGTSVWLPREMRPRLSMSARRNIHRGSGAVPDRKFSFWDQMEAEGVSETSQRAAVYSTINTTP